MRFDNGNFINAVFTNSKKNTIEATFKHEDETFESVVIEVDLNNEVYKKLLETFTIDQITQFTNAKINHDKINFSEFVLSMCKDRGLVYDANGADEKSKLVIDNLFAVPEGDTGTDLLFNIKMKCFELPEVTASTDTELKKKLRKATTPIEAFYITGKFLYE
jgi:hypothetical protein